MSVEFTSGGDPARSMELLWGLQERPRRGPKPRLSIEQIVEAATCIADAEGIGALSMRRVAESLGMTAMSLYTYVPGKAELLDLMIDGVYRETLPDYGADDDWRRRLELFAHAARGSYQRHPWMLQIGRASRLVLGPNVIANYERGLEAIEGLGLTDVEMDSIVEMLWGYVRESARGAVEAELAPELSGMSDEQWWRAQEPYLERFEAPERYPLACRVGMAVGEAFGTSFEPSHAFAFGLERVLDGIEVLVERRREPGAGTQEPG